jgi:tetratricopeptide (TPR) repeat protein
MGRGAALLSGVALTLGLSAAWAQGTEPVTGAPTVQSPDAPAGTYLAARAATVGRDFAAAAELLADALASDPGDAWLLDFAVIANLSLGRVKEAGALALQAVEAGIDSSVAHLALDVAHAAEGDWRGLLRDKEAGRTVGPLIDGLSRGWAWQGLEDNDAALSAFDELAAAPGLEAFGTYHKALALALQGDLEGANAFLATPEPEGPLRTRRSVLAHAEVLSALGRNPDAVAMINDNFGDNLDPGLLALRARLEAGESLPFTVVTSAAEGLAEAYLNVASALGDAEAETALLYARAALALDPGRSEAALLAATLLQALGQPALARDAFALVPAEDPSYLSAELGRAGVLRIEGEEEAALEVLSRLAQDFPDRTEVHSTHGDLLRSMERFADSEAAYDRAIELSPEGADTLWILHFARALAREGQNDWPGTEADLRRSLELNPDQPQVLNHLGYSLADRGEKLPESLVLLERAVALRPDSGAIVDSLGWALFRMGRFARPCTTWRRRRRCSPLTRSSTTTWATPIGGWAANARPASSGAAPSLSTPRPRRPSEFASSSWRV